MDPDNEEVASDSEHSVEEDELSDSEPPEDISWKESRDVVIQDRQKEQDAIQSIKKLKKEKEREKHQRNIQQKIDSKKSSVYSTLPASILQDVGKITREEEAQRKQQINESEDRTHVKRNKNLSEKKKNDSRIVQGINVQVLEKEKFKHKSLSTSAEEFLREHFYGDRVKREATVVSLSKKRKRKFGKPAIKFSKMET